MIVVLIGVTGSGKTTVGKVLANQLGCKFVDADDYHPAATSWRDYFDNGMLNRQVPVICTILLSSTSDCFWSQRPSAGRVMHCRGSNPSHSVGDRFRCRQRPLRWKRRRRLSKIVKGVIGCPALKASTERPGESEESGVSHFSPAIRIEEALLRVTTKVESHIFLAVQEVRSLSHFFLYSD